MNGIDILVSALHQGERLLAAGLLAVAERHRAEHEVRHVATDLAGWSREHVQRLAQSAASRGFDADRGPASSVRPPTALGAGLSEGGSRSAEPALLLLADLRDLHLTAACNSLHWEMLAQAAQALKDGELLSLASACHAQTLRQMRWTNTMIKNLSAQAVTSL
ncbi:hypothetical protein [Streptomyces vinaceus]|uniref:hypothetical protein n=1 Tax=Streptomyces vinaceus TaxID=1960 RepID=UPI0037FF4F0A